MEHCYQQIKQCIPKLHFDTLRCGLRCQQDVVIYWVALAPTPPTSAGTNHRTIVCAPDNALNRDIEE